jgi:hypothetical protein
MAESARRHGHFDPRYRVAFRRSPKLSIVSNGSGSIDRREVVAVPRPRLVLTGGRDDVRVADRENEGGYVVEPEQSDLGLAHLPAGRGWYEFLAARYPDARRHDLEALKAYEAYRSLARPAPD